MPRGLKAWAQALLCGALLALCLPRPGLCFLAWFSLAPLLALWTAEGPRKSSLTGFLAGFAYHGLALYWIYNTCRFAHLPVWIGLVAWGSLAAFLALHWAIMGLAGSWAAAGLSPALRPWGWAVVWTALAAAWERWTPRLATDLLAYTQWRHLSLIQIGSLLGPHGLGFLIALLNAALCEAWREAQGDEGPGAAAKTLALALALNAASAGYGLCVLANRAPMEPSARVEILQPAIDQYQKWDEAFEERIRGNFIELLSRPRPEKPHLIVWPESSLTSWVDEGGTIAEVSPWSRKLAAYQLVGAVSRADGRHYNSAFLIGPDGSVRGTYHKRELVPFGEFVPFQWVKRFVGLLNQMGGLTAGGPVQPLLATPLGLAAATICYEAMFPRWANLDASRGARLIVNVTNDGWYKDTWGPYQHFQSNVFRAIENRVVVIRSGNTGISAVIDPWGAVTARLDLNERGRLDAQVPLADPFPDRSFYARRGDWLGSLCLAAGLLLALARLLRRRE